MCKETRKETGRALRAAPLVQETGESLEAKVTEAEVVRNAHLLCWKDALKQGIAASGRLVVPWADPRRQQKAFCS